MTNPKIHRLGELQLKIMQALWDRPDATIAQVRAAVSPDASLAHSTIATMLRKMEARGLVKHRLLDRKFLYRALVREDVVARKMSEHFIERLFEGSLADMVSHLLKTQDISRQELERLEKLIAEQKRKL
ncbi:MAG: BlaI/MecI/CopY family transcriptional regulator [Verrucomicrobiota bacterium]|jgi:predicted transcriptional regulator